MYCLSALIVSLFATQACASTLTSRTITALQARQSLDPTDGNWGQCESKCQPWQDQTNACEAKATSDQAACLCDNSYVQLMGGCYNCIIGQQASFQDSAQKLMDAFASECSVAGFTIKEPTLDGKSNGASSAAGFSAVAVAGVVIGAGMVVFG